MWFIKLKKSNRCVFLSAQEQAGAAQLEGLLGPCLGGGAPWLWLPWRAISLPLPSTLFSTWCLWTTLTTSSPELAGMVCRTAFYHFPHCLRDTVNRSNSRGFYRQKEKGIVNCKWVFGVCVTLVSFPSKGELKNSYKEQLLLKSRVKKKTEPNETERRKPVRMVTAISTRQSTDNSDNFFLPQTRK